MWTLAVETSGRVASLAFLKDDRCVLIRSLDESGRRHARTLVASVRGCCRELGIIPAELGLIVVSEGPGSFTGLRVGVVFAKVLAFTHQIPLAAVNTLTVIAAGQAKVSGAIWPLIDAQRGDVFTARHEFQSDGRVGLEPSWPCGAFITRATKLAVCGLSAFKRSAGKDRSAPVRVDGTRPVKRALRGHR